MIFVFGNFLHAQNYKKVEPKLPEEQEVRQAVVESEVKPEMELIEEGKIVIKELRAIVFLTSEKDFHRDGLEIERNERTYISADDLPLLQTDEFRERMQPFLGKPTSMEKLRKLTQVVMEYYRERGQPIVWVRLPEQNVTTGVIQFIVMEARMGETIVSGEKWTNPEAIKEQLRIKQGEIVKQGVLLSDMEWMNRSPFRQVTAAYKAGKEPGTTDINFQVKDRFPVRFYTGYENTGSDITGQDRWFGGFNWGDAFGVTNNLFSYQFTTSSDFDGLQAHSASDIAPLPWRHLLNTFGSYNETEAELTSPLSLRGKSWNVGTRYIVPLPQVTFENDLWMDHNAQVGFDFKQSNNNLDFGGTLVTNSQADVDQFVYNYNATLHDPYGVMSLGASLYQSPGGLSDNNTTTKFQASRAMADAAYCYGRVELFRQTQLPWKFSINNTFVYQWSDENLLASEQLGLGGRDTIRGYEETEVRGDQGWYVRNEFCAPPLSMGELLKNLGCKDFNDRLVFLAFWDYGVVKNKYLLAGEHDIELSAVGPALRYNISPYLNASLDYGFQLLDSGNASPRNSKLNLSVTLSY